MSSAVVGLTLAKEIAQVRFILNEPDPDRFSDAVLTNQINIARRAVSLATRVIGIRTTGFAVAPVAILGTESGADLGIEGGGVFGLEQAPQYAPGIPQFAEYQLYEDVIDIRRIYVGGQRVIKTDIATLEGEGMELFDMSGPQYQPQWQIATAIAYPAGGDSVFPVATALPFYPGARPQYYERDGGGVIGFVPPPAGGEQIIIEGIGCAPDLINPSDPDIFPRYFLECIAQKAAAQCYGSDRNLDSMNEALQMYKMELETLRDQIAEKSVPRGIRPLTYRSTFQLGGPYRGRRNYGGRW